MNFAVVVVLVVAVSFLETSVDATICMPFSKFKIDCDECQCSEDGTEYSCTVRKCGPFAFLNEKQDDFILKRNKPHIRTRNIEIPYINDMIPPPGHEDVQNEYLEDLIYDEINPKEKSENDKEAIDDVDLSEQNASVFDADELPESDRRKRSLMQRKPGRRFIKPDGKRFIKPDGKRFIRPDGKRNIKPHRGYVTSHRFHGTKLFK
ncbi:hypothetical protein ILUMI_24937 [Ignelater luminosus]|uniref:Pacifastin domain-containing protein n=1 Tax=Ignelater luminosus TaxID=2038154 RepID=A0A8K0CBJ1_IGNLU|nr:hypothetical protein ILUMI_24937 [Ignelater luminosus]